MLAKVYTFGLLGIASYPIEVEVDVSGGLPNVILVGMADTCIKESRERIKSAIKNSGFEWPDGKVTVNLAPSDIKYLNHLLAFTSITYSSDFSIKLPRKP